MFVYTIVCVNQCVFTAEIYGKKSYCCVPLFVTIIMPNIISLPNYTSKNISKNKNIILVLNR